MSKKVNKLFLTRGVPGTHDTKILYKCLKNLKNNTFKKVVIPQFDKSKDAEFHEDSCGRQRNMIFFYLDTKNNEKPIFRAQKRARVTKIRFLQENQCKIMFSVKMHEIFENVQNR